MISNIDFVSVKEYAEIVGRAANSIRKSCERGRFKSARKIGRDWFIDRNEPFVDHRTKYSKKAEE